MPDADSVRVNLPCVLSERISDLRYVCEAQGWTDLLYLIDIVGHELKVRLAPSPDMGINAPDVPA